MHKSAPFLAACLGTLLLLSSPFLRADDASHLQAAHDLLDAADMKDSYNKTIDKMLDVQIKAAPQLAQMRTPLKEFFDKYMGWDSMKDDLAKIYVANFTEQELKEVAAFYRTPTGAKTVQKIPEVMAEGAQLGQQRVAAHMGELQDMIRQEMARKSSSAGTPASASSPAPAPAPANK